MKITLNILGFLTILFLASCKKNKVASNGYDSSFVNLVDYDSLFIGEWNTVTSVDYFYVNFNIFEQGNSHYFYNNFDDEEPVEIIKITKYKDNAIYLEGAKKIQINQFPILCYDTVVQYNVAIGPIKYVYSATMIIDSQKLYRIEEVVY